MRVSKSSVWFSAARIAIIALVTGILIPLSSLEASMTPAAVAADLSQFQAGNIIDDAVFFNGSAMTDGEIQTFLNSKVSSCRSGYTCLKDYTETTASIAANPMCSAYSGAASESAATIIGKVARACGISPKVLIVTLQKEQGLVTDTWPTNSQYRAAMGALCPDTAPCDSAASGFFKQVYTGAYLFKRYTQPAGTGSGTEYSSRFDLMYPVGQTSNVLYNPDSSCGTASVYISNQATHVLYVYTPYTPNAAALAAGYSASSDSCSSYGNRNFFNYFTDWFGSVRAGMLFRSASDPTVYLVDFGATTVTKFPITNLSVYYALLSTMGPVSYTSASYLAGLATGPEATTLMRNANTYEIWLAANGSKNKFTDCDTIYHWNFGANCGSYINVSSKILDKFATSAPMTRFAVDNQSGLLYYITLGSRRAMHSMAQMTSLGGSSASYNWIPSATLAALAIGPDYIDQGTAMKFPGSPQVYLVTDSQSLAPVNDYATFTAFGFSTVTTSFDPTLARWTVANNLTLGVTCPTQSYLASGGQLWGVASGTGLPSTALSASACAQLRLVAPNSSGAALLRNSTTGSIYSVSAGKKTFLASWAAVTAVGGNSPQLIGVSGSYLDTIPEVVSSGSIVKSASSTTLYLVNGTTKIPIPSGVVYVAFGMGGFLTVSDATISALTTASPLGLSVICSGNTYFASEGKIWQIPTNSGLSAVTLDTAACSTLTVSPQVSTTATLLRNATTGGIYSVAGGTKTFLSTWAAVVSLAGSSPVLIPASVATLNSISDTAASGTLVKGSASSTIYFVNGSNRIPIASWATATAFGFSDFLTISEDSLTTLVASSAPLTQGVVCNSQTYLATSGMLWAIPSSSGIQTTSLDASACLALTISPQTSTSGPLLRDTVTGSIYSVANGAKTFLSTWAQVTAIGGANPVLIPVSTSYLNSLL